MGRYSERQSSFSPANRSMNEWKIRNEGGAFEIRNARLNMLILTRSARDLAIDSVPLLPEVVLDALEPVECAHLLRPLARA